MRSGPFGMSSSGNESHGQCASYAFGFVKKYLFFQKLQPKTFCGQKNSTRFFEKIFSKNFSKNPKFWFFKILKISIFIDFSTKKTRKNDFFKNQNFDFFKSFLKIFFQKKQVEFFWPQKVFGCNFWKNKYFFTNPKAYEAACPWLPFPLLDIKNGPLRKKVIPKKPRGVF